MQAVYCTIAASLILVDGLAIMYYDPPRDCEVFTTLFETPTGGGTITNSYDCGTVTIHDTREKWSSSDNWEYIDAYMSVCMVSEKSPVRDCNYAEIEAVIEFIGSHLY
jgi:hypothetical protein